MQAIELDGSIDELHRLNVIVPGYVPIGRVRAILLGNGEDSSGARWADGAAREWAAELADTQEDIYTVEDGLPISTMQ